MGKEALIAVFLMLGSQAFGQSACPAGHGDLCHPPSTGGSGGSGGGGGGGRNVPICDSDCQDAREEAADRRRQREAAEEARKAENKVIDKANKLGAKAWDLLNRDKCAEAIPLYNRALALAPHSPWSQNLGYCYDKIARPEYALFEYRKVYADPATTPENRKRIRQAMWSNLYDLGYHCPALEDRLDSSGKSVIRAYPEFKGDVDGCVGILSKIHNPTYVAMQNIEGKTWHPINFVHSSPGTFVITTSDGRRLGPGDDIMNANLLNARIQTGAGTAVRITLPDGHDFVLGPLADITLDDFVYNPNTNMTEVIIQNLIGVARFVTATMQKPETEIINAKLPVGSLGIRGTDIEIWHENDLWHIFTFSGEVTFTDNKGRSIVIPPGKELVFTEATAPGDLLPNYDGPILHVTDEWNMDPNRRN